MVNSKNDTNKLLLDSVVDYSMKNELIDEKEKDIINRYCNGESGEVKYSQIKKILNSINKKKRDSIPEFSDLKDYLNSHISSELVGDERNLISVMLNYQYKYAKKDSNGSMPRFLDELIENARLEIRRNFYEKDIYSKTDPVKEQEKSRKKFSFKTIKEAIAKHINFKEEK